jgi:4-alpha-glucanotransferase
VSQRFSGILCHPTSFPGPHGIGDMGDAAFRFVDWLALSGQRLWQILPLTPPGPGHSPYASPSAFAGNPLLISLAWLAGDGLLGPEAIEQHPRFPDYAVDFGTVIAWKLPLLREAFSAFRRGAATHLRPAFERFRVEAAGWLDDYALFMALKDAHAGAGWLLWEPGVRRRDPDALAAARERYAEDIRFHQFVQFQFRRQWAELRRYANERDIRIVGDLPIFVAHDSADVWARQRFFRLDSEGRPVVVAGVPPDAFSETGQHWGNPHYDWEAIADDGYAWWIERVRASLQLVDVLRIDHFRGFAAAWVIPVDAPSAAGGRWERGPGAAVFAAIERALGDSPFIVEDLGVITDDVVALREELGLPGMKVLQFAFGGDPDNFYLPHTYSPNCVVYPATHDNQTTIGWFASLPEWQRHNVQRYLGKDGGDIAWDLIRLALASVATMAIVPLQDVMRLNDDARMNVPGRADGNWSWRYAPHLLHPGLGAGLAELTAAYGRRPPRTDDPGRDPFDYTAPFSAHRLFTAADPWLA